MIHQYSLKITKSQELVKFNKLCYLQLAVCVFYVSQNELRHVSSLCAFMLPKVNCAIYSAQFVCVWI